MRVRALENDPIRCEGIDGGRGCLGVADARKVDRADKIDRIGMTGANRRRAGVSPLPAAPRARATTARINHAEEPGQRAPLSIQLVERRFCHGGSEPGSTAMALKCCVACAVSPPSAPEAQAMPGLPVGSEAAAYRFPALKVASRSSGVETAIIRFEGPEGAT